MAVVNIKRCFFFCRHLWRVGNLKRTPVRCTFYLHNTTENKILETVPRTKINQKLLCGIISAPVRSVLTWHADSEGSVCQELLIILFGCRSQENNASALQSLIFQTPQNVSVLMKSLWNIKYSAWSYKVPIGIVRVITADHARAVWHSRVSRRCW